MPASFGPRPLLAASPAASALASVAGAQSDPLKRREGTFKIKDFRFESGTVMPEVTIAYETYGTLAPDGCNAVLLTHGYTSGQHMAGRSGANGVEGSWDGLVGPDKAIATERIYYVAPNM